MIAAVKAGYRMLDCANDYDNEHVVGEALRELFAAGIVTREELFIQVRRRSLYFQLRLSSGKVTQVVGKVGQLFPQQNLSEKKRYVYVIIPEGDKKLGRTFLVTRPWFWPPSRRSWRRCSICPRCFSCR